MRSCTSLLLLLGLTLGLGQAHAAGPVNAENPGTPLHWVASNLPPFGWIDKHGAHGYGYELVAQMSARLGRTGETPFYPWARAIRMVQDANDGAQPVGTFPVSRSPDREASFHWLILLSHGHYAFFVRADSKLNLKDVNSLRNEPVAVLRGSPLMANLRGRKFTRLVEAQDYKDMLRLLSQGMVSAVISTESILRAAIDEYKFKSADFRSGGEVGGADLFLATSTNLDPAEADRWLKAYRELEQDGTVARLQKKYLHER